MSNQFILNAFRDILPTESEPFPKELTDYANLLYLTSKSKASLTPQFEVARYHICCYLSAEKFATEFELAEPSVNKIPVPQRKIRSLVNEFKRSLINGGRQSAPTTPKKRRAESQLATPQSSGKKKLVSSYDSVRSNAKHLHSPLTPASTPQKHGRIQKRLEHGDSDIEDDKEEPTYDNPYVTPTSTPSKKRITSITKPKTSSIKDKLQMAANEKDEDDIEEEQWQDVPMKKEKIAKQKPKSKVGKTDGSTGTITTAHLVSFCNRFYLPEEITKNILKTFQDYHYRIRNSWGLLCGLVSIAYLRMNSERVESQLGFKSKFYKNLQLLQNGKLKFEELTNWIKLVENLCGHEKWIRDLDDLYNLKSESQLPFGIPSLNSFISADTCYFSNRMADEYETWVEKISRGRAIE
ncbi:hypothetical protein CANARDRAFT_28762 [[Candida] arabinofermentans NRRL YB-2248]|uniref:ORC6 first cyclin-like domain-containing protein n=1 Tax=[Candida] arabinofermentans NRRL YB-2248 TaxID=983967 RepID=A0A1E4T005_9ASCO|nr:hypothetical protein CANARDRAFT_28762 [[Candida] arabinofermentans NRRL YB-2248]